MIALTWIILLANILLIALASLAHQQVDFLSWTGNTAFYPAVFWSLIALFLIVMTFFCPNGITWLLAGKRLNFTASFWRALNSAHILFFISLGVLAVAVNQLSSHAIWSAYKLFAQPVLLIVVPPIYIKALLTCSPTRRACQ